MPHTFFNPHQSIGFYKLILERKKGKEKETSMRYIPYIPQPGIKSLT